MNKQKNVILVKKKIMSRYQKTAPVRNQQNDVQDQNDPKLSKTTQQRRSLDQPKPTFTQRNDNSFPSSKMSQKDMDSACYRLSRTPQKFKANKNKIETNQNYAQNYYASNPDVQIDTRPPKEKLEEIDKKLSDGGDMDENEKFDLLVQQKSLRSLVYGENSPESVQSMTALGAFYNEQGHPDSALRHLSKAKQTEKTTQLSEEDSFRLAVELADANMNATSNSRQEKNKKIDAADRALSPHIETETSDKKLGYRRDLYVAEIASKKKRYGQAVKYYEKAGDNFLDAHDEKTKEMAELYVKGAEAAQAQLDREERKKEQDQEQEYDQESSEEIEQQDQQKNEANNDEKKEEKVDYQQKEKELYQKAINVYEDLNEHELADKLRPFVEEPPPEQQDEDEQQHQEDNENEPHEEGNDENHEDNLEGNDENPHEQNEQEQPKEEENNQNNEQPNDA